MQGPDPVISTFGDVRAEEVAYATEKITTLYPKAHWPITHALIRLRSEPNPRISEPSIAEATLEISGHTARGHVAATTLTEAIDLLEDKLARQIRRLGDRAKTLQRRAVNGKLSSDHEWRSGTANSSRPGTFERPTEEREVVRRKAFNLHPLRADEAAFDMEMLDHDFYLFTDVDSGEDRCLERAADGPYVLHGLHGTPKAPSDAATEIEAAADVAPTLDLDGAIELLDHSGAGFLFFLNRDSDRGNIVYRRYDGHYGHIVPGDGA